MPTTTEGLAKTFAQRSTTRRSCSQISEHIQRQQYFPHGSFNRGLFGRRCVRVIRSTSNVSAPHLLHQREQRTQLEFPCVQVDSRHQNRYLRRHKNSRASSALDRMAIKFIKHHDIGRNRLWSRSSSAADP